MTLTDILLIVAIVLLLLLFLAIPVLSRMARTRDRSPRETRRPTPAALVNPETEKAAAYENNGHDLSGGTRVEEPAAALESGYRRVDPAHDLPGTQAAPGKKNGKPH